ncbi:MAG: hypothetical protein H6839_09960 [Planctomycetes bacterium]|nr:hypothetical protein [Planctomycetota bacterium]
MQRPLSPVTFRCTLRQYVVVGIVLAVFFAMGIALVVLEVKSDRTAQTIALGAGCAIVSGYFGAKSWYRVIWNRPVLTLDAEGIDDQASVWRLGRFAWDDIGEVAIVVKRNGHRRLVVVPSEQATWGASMTTIKRLLYAVFASSGADDALAWPEAILPTGTTLETVIAVMQKLRPELEVTTRQE